MLKRMSLVIILSVLLILIIVPWAPADTDISSPDTGQVDGESGVGCGDSFCAIAWQRVNGNQASLMAKVLNSSGSPVGAEITIAQNLATSGRIQVRGGKNSVLIIESEASSMRAYILDSLGSVKGPISLQSSSEKVGAAFDPSLYNFLIFYSTYTSSLLANDIYGYVIGEDGVKVSQNPSPVIATTESETAPFAVYDGNRGKFILVYSAVGSNKVKVVSGNYNIDSNKNLTFSMGTPVTLFQLATQLAAGGSLVFNNRIFETSYTFVSAASEIYTSTFHLDQSDSIIKDMNRSRSFPGQSVALSYSPMAFDGDSNRHLLIFNRVEGGTPKAYLQVIDGQTMDNIGAEKLIGASTSSTSLPSISSFSWTNNYTVSYSSSNKIISKKIDSSGNDIVSKKYTQPTDSVTSQYTLVDDNGNRIQNGYTSVSDTFVLFNHSTYGERLIGVLEFSKSDANLATFKIDSTENATALDRTGIMGLKDVVVIVPDNNNDGGVRVCPSAKKVTEIVPGCQGELVFSGPFPQSMGAVSVDVYKSAFGSKNIYGVSGLTGSGVSTVENGTIVPQQNRLKANFSLSSIPTSQDNKSYETRASYTFNSTPIAGASCIISYSDQTVGSLPQQYQMTFDSVVYKHNRTFQSPPSNVNAVATCSQSNYTQESSTISLSGSNQNQPTSQSLSVSLSSPKSTQTSNNITFSCSATGSDLKELSLYTDTSGVWKKEGTKSISSQTTQQFQLSNIKNGSYTWNCEARTNSGTVLFAAQNESFEVRIGASTPLPSSSCESSTDCNQWQPDICPQSQTQTRTCSNIQSCSYPLTRTCVYTGQSTTSSPTNSTAPKPPPKGIDITTIILLIATIIAVVILSFLFIRKRRSSSEEDETLYGEAGYGSESEQPGDENEEGQPQ